MGLARSAAGALALLALAQPVHGTNGFMHPTYGVRTPPAYHTNSGVNGACVAPPYPNNLTASDATCCPGGMLMPDLPMNTGVLIVWVLLLCWVFLGVALGADAFMAAIETITSQTQVTTVSVGGKKQRFHTQVWNDTVANLTLMALGSSAPEILLSVLEVAAMNPKGTMLAGELGPSTIVGSASFNLMVITAVCIIAIPKGEVRTLKHLNVFLVTATFSVFAYIWLIIILVFWTPNLVTVLEAALTFSFMFVLVGVAFAADKGYLSASKYSSKLKVIGVHAAYGDGFPPETGPSPDISASDIARYLKELEDVDPSTTNQISEGSSTRKSSADAKAPPRQGGLGKHAVVSADPELLAQGFLAAKESARPPTKGDARRAVMVGLTGKKAKALKRQQTPPELILQHSDITMDDVAHSTFVGFSAASCIVSEGEHEFATCRVTRGGCMEGTLSVHYATEAGTATADSDYVTCSGELVFGPGETSKEVRVTILDDDEVEDDEEFYVQLSAPTISGVAADAAAVTARLGGPKLHARCAVVIKDDDVMPGTLSWKASEVRVVESQKHATLTVERRRGHNGVVTVAYKTRQEKALEGIDYVGAEGVLTFESGELSKDVVIEIIDDSDYEKDETFLVVLSKPTGGALFQKDTNGREDEDICTVTIESDGQVASKVDRVMALLSVDRQRMTSYRSQWIEQVREAVTLEERTPKGVVLFVLMVPWRLLFGLMPPADMCKGKLLFVGALVGIALQVVLIGDLASQMGCEMGIRDSITAITFVALGTSLPDTFASMKAAVDDTSADNSVGNVTGSNSVNVFLGLGVPWLMASIYWAATGPTDEWKAMFPNVSQQYPGGGFVVCAGSLAFSVTVFTVCAIITLCGIMLRRKFGGQELGGNRQGALATAGAFVFLWFIYVIFSVLRAEQLVDSFNTFLKPDGACP